ncbi:MAG: TIGR00282 family metallophosphoesterase [Evtepia sp.]
MGLLPRHADEIFDAGADVITLGNHTWSRLQIADHLDQAPCILRPANLLPISPAGASACLKAPRGLRIGVLNLMGRFELDSNLSSPFEKADRILAGEGKDADVMLVDFHAEATSEKGALAWYLDGRAQAVWGTHTHVPTADTQILPKGTGFVTDLGMTGPARSILGVKPENSIARFLGPAPPALRGRRRPLQALRRPLHHRHPDQNLRRGDARGCV